VTSRLDQSLIDFISIGSGKIVSQLEEKEDILYADIGKPSSLNR
jgi:hypothetical protein